MNQDAWTQAMDEAMNALLDKTGHTEGQEAFRYEIPPGAWDVWKLSIGGGPDERDMFCSGIESLRMNGMLEGRFADVAEAQHVAIQWVSALPIRNQGNLSFLRMTAPPSIELRGFPTSAPDTQMALYVVTMPLECIVDVSDG